MVYKNFTHIIYAFNFNEISSLASSHKFRNLKNRINEIARKII